MAFILAALFVLAVYAFGCEKGCEPYQGVCACEAPTEAGPPPVQPSNEEPPRSGMPGWQAPDIHVIDVPSCAADDAKQDAERDAADIVGKKAAGLK